MSTPKTVARRITAWSGDADEPGVWIASLDCGHRRHVRHRPPLSSYPWVVDAAERAAKLGAPIECDRCARAELPTEAAEYRSTDLFDEHTLPSKLQAEHRTKPGVWGRVEVVAGSLRFVMVLFGIDRVLGAGDSAVIPPEIVHHVEPVGAMRMRVVFLRVG